MYTLILDTSYDGRDKRMSSLYDEDKEDVLEKISSKEKEVDINGFEDMHMLIPHLDIYLVQKAYLIDQV